jgi:excinuclease UvrABC ATPase subunit
VDRIVLKPEIRSRLADSIETALKLAGGTVVIAVADAGPKAAGRTGRSARSSPARSTRR